MPWGQGLTVPTGKVGTTHQNVLAQSKVDQLMNHGPQMARNGGSLLARMMLQKLKNQY